MAVNSASPTEIPEEPKIRCRPHHALSPFLSMDDAANVLSGRHLVKRDGDPVVGRMTSDDANVLSVVDVADVADVTIPWQCGRIRWRRSSECAGDRMVQCVPRGERPW